MLQIDDHLVTLMCESGADVDGSFPTQEAAAHSCLEESPRDADQIRETVVARSASDSSWHVRQTGSSDALDEDQIKQNAINTTPLVASEERGVPTSTVESAYHVWASSPLVVNKYSAAEDEAPSLQASSSASSAQRSVMPFGSLSDSTGYGCATMLPMTPRTTIWEEANTQWAAGAHVSCAMAEISCGMHGRENERERDGERGKVGGWRASDDGCAGSRDMGAAQLTSQRANVASTEQWHPNPPNNLDVTPNSRFSMGTQTPALASVSDTSRAAGIDGRASTPWTRDTSRYTETPLGKFDTPSSTTPIGDFSGGSWRSQQHHQPQHQQQEEWRKRNYISSVMRKGMRQQLRSSGGTLKSDHTSALAQLAGDIAGEVRGQWACISNIVGRMIRDPTS